MNPTTGPLERGQLVAQLLGVVEHPLDLGAPALHPGGGEAVQGLGDPVQHAPAAAPVYGELL